MAMMVPGKYAYFEGKYVPIEDAKISIMTHAFNYGTGLFEGIRGYYSSKRNSILIFKLDDHIDRLVRNCKIFYMEISESFDDIKNICIELVKRSEFKEGVYIRPIVYKSELSLGPLLKGVESKLCCYVIKLGDYCDINTGLDVCVSSWRRLEDNAIPSRVKATGSYINSALAASEAKQAGFSEAIFLNENGFVVEGSAMNIFMVLNGDLITPPRSDSILVGITRNTVIELAQKELGLKVIERPIARTELYVADEIFFCGTGAQVAPVKSIDRRIIGNGEPGPITKQLQKIYFDVVLGENEKYLHWCTIVPCD